MDNKITEKYFTHQDFSVREAEVLEEVLVKTNFQITEEIFRGRIYDHNKVGSLIYRGEFEGKPAVLKLQGLRPEKEEADIVREFSAQNQSDRVRLPEVYAYEPWREECEYGYTISEYIDAPHIFTLPFATADEMRNFADFYQEYRTKAITAPWVTPETTDTLNFMLTRMRHWQKISEHKARLDSAVYADQLARYFSLAEQHAPSIPMVFCHGHLTANDIYRQPDGSYVLMSNLFWSYRPQYYDVAFNLWACLLAVRDTDYTFAQYREYFEAWLETYRGIPIVAADEDFERKFLFLMLERTVGAVMVDLGANDIFAKEENQQYLQHLIGLHRELFDYLVERIRGL